MSYSPVESSCRADATYFLRTLETEKLRIRPVYRAFRKLVKIPVDIKFGMREKYGMSRERRNNIRTGNGSPVIGKISSVLRSSLVM